MGGKTKQSQRTKNNVRPSSSGRSALLLDSGKLTSGVMSTELPALFPSLAAPTIDSMVSPELQLCIKKLNKKDPITKTKALQELTELVRSSKVEEVVGLLPSWAHFYRQLTTDPDRKVREVTQLCHGSIVSACGRRVAPHLKALVPAWLQAQYDEHAPAHTHAQASLTRTFPDSKLPEVISFCKDEIISHLVDNLTGPGEPAYTRKWESPEERALQESRAVASSLRGLQYCTLHLRAEPRIRFNRLWESPEERALQESRAVASSLRGLQYCTLHLRAEHHAWLWDHLDRLLHLNTFWKRASHADHNIRAAWYALVGSVVARYSSQFAPLYAQRALRVLTGARDSSPLAAAQLWDTLLLFMHHITEWYKYLDKTELFSKRVLDVLESGGWGDARHLSNVMLPLLAHLPPDLVTKQFYLDFFQAMLTGLEKKTIVSSKSERQCWITSLEECLRYLSTHEHEYTCEVVGRVLRAWLRCVLRAATDAHTRAGLVRHSAAAMAALIKYWLKRDEERFDTLVRTFWQNVGATLTAQLDDASLDRADVGALVDAHVLLLQTLKLAFVQEAKKQQSIKFDGDSPTVAESPRESSQCDAAVVDRYNHNLNDTVHKMCAHYLELAGDEQVSSAVLAPLVTLVGEFESASLFREVARQLGCESASELYARVLRPRLAGGGGGGGPDLVRLVLLLRARLPEREQDDLFDSFNQLPPSVVEWCVHVCVSHPHRGAASVRRWLRSTLVARTLAAVCERLLLAGDCGARDLLLLCLDHDAQGETLLSESAVCALVQQVSVGMVRECAALETVASLGARLVTTLSGASLQPLVLALFQLSVQVPRGGGELSADTCREVRAACQDGLAALPAAQRATVLRRAADVLRDTLHLHEPVDLKQMEHVISLCPYLLSTNSEQDIAEIVEFTCRLFKDLPLDPLVETFVLRHMIVRGEINCPYIDDNVTGFITDDHQTQVPEMTKENLVPYMSNCSFRAVYLRTVLLHKVDEDLEDTWCNDLLADCYFTTEFCKLLYDYCVIDFLYKAYAFWEHYRLIENTKERLHMLIDDVITECTLKTKSHLLNTMADMAATKGYFWSFARRWFEVHAKLDPTSQDIKDNENMKSENCNETTDAVGIVEGSPANVEPTIESFQNKTNDALNQAKDENPEWYKEETFDLEKIQEIVTGSGFIHTLQANEYYAASSAPGSLRARYLVMLRSMHAAHCTEERVMQQFLSDVTAGQDTCDADVIVNAYYHFNHVMLYDTDVSRAPWCRVVSNAAVVEYLGALVEHRGWGLPAHHWDFVCITLCNLLSAVCHSRDSWGSTKVALLGRAVLRLFLCVERFVGGVKAECERRPPTPHVAHLPHEWADVFVPDLHRNLLDLVWFVLEQSTVTAVTANHIGVVEALVSCTRRVAGAGAGTRRVAAHACVGRAEVAARALASSAHYCFKYLAYEALLMLLEPLVLDDAEALAAWSAGQGEGGPAEEQEHSAPPSLLRHYDAPLRTLQDLVTTALAHVRVCEGTCALQEGSDVHRLALGWFLLADVLAQQCRLARGDLHHHYVNTYRERRHLEPLLTSALRLLPDQVFEHVQRADGAPHLPAPHQDMFTSLPPLHVYSYCSARTVSAAACRALYWCCAGAGAGDARGWRGAAPHKHARMLDALVHTYISPHVVKEEFTRVQQRAAEIEDTKVTIFWSTFEVCAVLTVEERPLELHVKLSRSHPLGLPRVEAPERAPLANTNWLVMYLAYQNGSVLNALKMWHDAVSTRMERAAQCYICYCRLHYATGRLPSATCRQCRNKFHGPCLRKWFESSHKSSCPMCRSAF